MEILRIPTHYTTQLTYMSSEDKAYIFEVLMRLSIWEQIELEKSMRWWIALSIWTEAVQLENKASAKKWKSLKIDIAPMVQPMEQSNFNNEAPKSNQVNTSQTKPNQNNSIQILSKDKEQRSEIVLKKITLNIDNLIKELKDTADKLEIAYDNKKDRNFAKFILTAKEYWNFCEKIWQDRIEFAKNIMLASVKISFWKWVCAWPMMIYQNYSEVYNKALEKKNNTNNKKWLWVTEI